MRLFRGKKTMGGLRTVLLTLLLLIVGGAAFVWSGVYDIGADAPHWAATRMAIAVLRERAIKTHAAGIKVPADLNDPARLREGAEHYAEMCTGCHLAPGMGESEMRAGLYPTPPDFSRMRQPVDAARAFWIIKHGIKFTAMPAWGVTHSDDKIWDIVAFVRQLPRMSPEAYRAATEGDHGDGGDHHDGAGHDHSTMPIPPATAAKAPAAPASASVTPAAPATTPAPASAGSGG